MTDGIDKTYVQRYVDLASSTDSEAIKADALYRAGTQMEVIPCDGDTNLSSEKQQIVLNAAEELLGGSNA